jgi:hypothetical protein
MEFLLALVGYGALWLAIAWRVEHLDRKEKKR